ncbi:hypothetical protein CQ12_06040 [Bradyrhizobium jicamae]|uniref:Uncharacterized protein n=1 Tax=Bradyrhizobium jicamae TaxID=280332 RepID=A0A0R3LQ71_9BRAD|nr:hypothetical protein [Bradyrhizobium jicamae]KRR09970.1 hypothetical protein CQ12_06040 [Bradyrhizobium jicamae]
MSEREDFEAFLREWTEANIGSLGDMTDPSDHQYYYKRRAEQLQEDAAAKGYSVQIRRLGLSYACGLREYIEGVCKRRY